ncbi:nitroreductase family deazaflavin-dependent oxidoreductase [Kribbella deserti]|uniref:Nitroreductase family deazaflavin-dependent oxidoreductase n=1 Tax=Kribbella deserti TaxID=1926257 RepID=A0ABV6QF63_9ACTN
MVSQSEEIHDSPVDWVHKHLQQFLATDGKQGRSSARRLLLTTRGRRSGALRRTVLNYWTDGPRFLVVGSNGGSARHPAWYLNLCAEPEVTVQVGAEVFQARATTVTADEKARYWPQFVATMPSYADFQRKTSRDIPVALLIRN